MRYIQVYPISEKGVIDSRKIQCIIDNQNQMASITTISKWSVRCSLRTKSAIINTKYISLRIRTMIHSPISIATKKTRSLVNDFFINPTTSNFNEK
jgi:hypothetical protein